MYKSSNLLPVVVEQGKCFRIIRNIGIYKGVFVPLKLVSAPDEEVKDGEGCSCGHWDLDGDTIGAVDILVVSLILQEDGYGVYLVAALGLNIPGVLGIIDSSGMREEMEQSRRIGDIARAGNACVD